MKVKIGIDPSIRSTGICIDDGKYITYYLITSKITQKLKKLIENDINVISIEHDSQKGLTGSEKESVKTMNVRKVLEAIKDIISPYNDAQVNIEAIAFSATGTIDQLAGLNYGIRNLVLDKGFDLAVINPTSLKLKTVGNGQAPKEDMVRTWNILTGLDFPLDDIADAYHLCRYD